MAESRSSTLWRAMSIALTFSFMRVALFLLLHTKIITNRTVHFRRWFNNNWSFSWLWLFNLAASTTAGAPPHTLLTLIYLADLTIIARRSILLVPDHVL
ncbi:hypothetical protein RB195_004673 [Necator americanus]|uniref:G-protein coupled receptors family 1 profile domain-containing protein n=1 Tax=Necator americanus TaxID=51031 RepID=A0ABR1BJ53_NECAM